MLKTKYTKKVNDKFLQDLRIVMNYLAIIFNMPMSYYSCNTLIACKGKTYYTFGTFYDNNANAATNRCRMAILSPCILFNVEEDPRNAGINNVLTHASGDILQPVTAFLSPYFNKEIDIFLSIFGLIADINELVKYDVLSVSSQDENTLSAYHELLKDAFNEAANTYYFNRNIATTYNSKYLNLVVHNTISNKFFCLNVGNYTDISILTNSTEIFNKGKLLGVKIQRI